MPVTLTAGSVHTLVVLDGSSGTQDRQPDRRGGEHGLAEGRGGDRVRRDGPAAGPGLAPWLGTLAGGVLLAFAGGFGLRRSRRTATADAATAVRK